MDCFPDIRLRRMRQTAAMRRMLAAPFPGPERFMWPVFVVAGNGVCEPIDAMPGQFRYSVDHLLEALKPVVALGIGGVLIFGLAEDDRKDANGSYAFNSKGPVQAAVRAVRKAFPELLVFTDVCLCAYTLHGHCGPLDEQGDVSNDMADALLSKVALSHAEAGAHGVAPSAMMDGQVAAIREALDDEGFSNTILMSYSTKFASAMYGPFREAEKSSPQSGDRKGYQAAYGDLSTALRESDMDEAEGADILMVKPSLFYLDVLSKLRERTDLPIAAYNVSGEYAMLIATADRGWGDLHEMVRESIVALDRAGADIIISYWANQYSQFAEA
ncbi:MAG: porphobilinogen synthase [Lentisphaerae bacterium]|nr:porphobilinogen synthase [Lentisphaerota bacterium]